jgi:hypothetical protein
MSVSRGSLAETNRKNLSVCFGEFTLDLALLWLQVKIDVKSCKVIPVNQVLHRPIYWNPGGINS